MYNEDDGLVMLNPVGEPFPRMRGNLPPCKIDRRAGGGCDKGTPEHNLNHTPQNRQAYEHYKQCKATGDWPRVRNEDGSDGPVDPIVKQNAAIIAEAEEAWQREEWAKFRISALEMLSISRSI